MVGTTLTMFDDPGAFTPSLAVYDKRRHDWDAIAGDFPRFEAMPPMPDSAAAE